MFKKVLSVAGILMPCYLAAPALAAPILGSNVDSAVFASSIGATSGWSYLGQSTSAFTMTGTATLQSRSSGYANSFGYSNTGHGGRVELFSTAATSGASTFVTGYSPSYLFYFQANGSDTIFFSDDNRQYTDGFDSGSTPGENQGDIDIFFNAAMSKWAFFFDDAGGGLPVFGDDNDYDDLVITFQQVNVPEPGAIGLMGLALLGMAGMIRRRKAA